MSLCLLGYTVSRLPVDTSITNKSLLNVRWDGHQGLLGKTM